MNLIDAELEATDSVIEQYGSQEDPPSGETKIYVGYSVSPVEFYVHTDDASETFIAIWEALNEAYSTGDVGPFPLNLFKPGAACVVRPARKEPYQRGVIVDVSGWECSVQLVDSGNMFIKHITDLKPLLKKFPLADHPPVAYHCRCIGILKSQLSAEMNLNFRQFIRDRKFIARFKTTSEPYQVQLIDIASAKPVIELLGIETQIAEQIKRQAVAARLSDDEIAHLLAVYSSSHPCTSTKICRVPVNVRNAAVIETVDDCFDEAMPRLPRAFAGVSSPLANDSDVSDEHPLSLTKNGQHPNQLLSNNGRLAFSPLSSLQNGVIPASNGSLSSASYQNGTTFHGYGIIVAAMSNYGFLVSLDSKQIYFHQNRLPDQFFEVREREFFLSELLDIGQTVEFEAKEQRVQGMDGCQYRATKVTPLDRIITETGVVVTVSADEGYAEILCPALGKVMLPMLVANSARKGIPFYKWRGLPVEFRATREFPGKAYEFRATSVKISPQTLGELERIRAGIEEDDALDASGFAHQDSHNDNRVLQKRDSDANYFLQLLQKSESKENAEKPKCYPRQDLLLNLLCTDEEAQLAFQHLKNSVPNFETLMLGD